MSEEKKARPGLWDRTYQVGVAVRDLDQAISFYERLGIGPFVEGPSAHSVMRKVYGEDAPDTRVSGKIAQMGNIEFELLSPLLVAACRGTSSRSAARASCTSVATPTTSTADIEEMARLGFEIISQGEFDDGGKFAYFDTRESRRGRSGAVPNGIVVGLNVSIAR